MKRITKRSSIIAAVTAVTLVAGGGVAFAYWTSNGTGSASADVASAAGNLTVTQSGTITGLYPGGPAQNVSVKVANTTGSAIQFASVAVSVTGTNASGCTAADFSVTDLSAGGALVPAGGNTVITPATVKMVESGANQDACKGAAVALSLTAS